MAALEMAFRGILEMVQEGLVWSEKGGGVAERKGSMGAKDHAGTFPSLWRRGRHDGRK